MQSVPGVAAIVVMGVSGAGKSTVGQIDRGAARLPVPRCRQFSSARQYRQDEERCAAHRRRTAGRGSRAIAAWIAEHRAAGTTCVVTCSALKRAYRDIVTDAQRADVRLVYLKGDFDLIAARLAARKGHFMPPALLQSQFDALQEPAPDEHAITVSIDATPEQIAARVVDQLT